MAKILYVLRLADMKKIEYNLGPPTLDEPPKVCLLKPSKIRYSDPVFQSQP